MVVFGMGFAMLFLVGRNAIKVADEAALAHHMRLAASHLEAAISEVPVQQRSATVWDDAIFNTRARNTVWMDENLGSWMQDYFGHDENFVLNQHDEPVFAAAESEIRTLEAYSAKEDVVGSFVQELRGMLTEAAGDEDSYPDVLAESEVVGTVRLAGRPAIISVVPIVSDSGEVPQVPGTEYLHVAVRYLTSDLARQIGVPIELDGVSFMDEEPTGPWASIPLSTPTGEPLTWFAWQRDQPGTEILASMRPALWIVGLTSAAFVFWLIQRLVRVSARLQARECQAQKDLAELKRAREAAEAADRAKMNFMSVVSHELRTPLTVILGYARLGRNIQRLPTAQRMEEEFRRHPIDPDLIKASVDEVLEFTTTGMEKIDKSGEHLLFLVNQLLDYAKIETGRLEVDPEYCDVSEVLKPVLDQMTVLSEQKGLVLEASVPSKRMFADIIRTKQILINLLGNAIKFTDTGKISVTVTDSQDAVHIAVSDTGLGIARSDIEKIFEAFHQADDSTTRRASGTGLGLALARELARLEGGSIAVESEVGFGSTFTLSLPKREPVVLAQVA